MGTWLTGNGEEARPGVAPGVRRSAGTLFAALYGELKPHPWIAPDSDRDAYLLFRQRSLAMGWLNETAGGLWGMNDAGRDHPLATSEVPLAAWFQVGMESVGGERPMPVQPFLCCAGDAAARLGTLGLQAVQVLLPVHALDVSSRPAYAPIPSLFTAEWFDDCDPRSRTPVRVTLDSGQAPSLPAAAPHLREQFDRLNQNVFACEARSPAEHEPLPMRPPFDDGFWNGPPLHRQTFHGRLAEWSLDALGWLGGLLAELSAQHGVTTPLLLTISRS